MRDDSGNMRQEWVIAGKGNTNSGSRMLDRYILNVRVSSIKNLEGLGQMLSWVCT